jgi:nucleoside 2-deoxyribosyltransferase
MPFAACFDAIWQSIIREAVLEQGDECVRADDASAPGYIITEMLDHIRRADYLICDLTGRNPNVYYELGFAHALGKPAILLTQCLIDVTFDVRYQRVLEYEDTVAGAVRLREGLRRYLVAMKADRLGSS